MIVAAASGAQISTAIPSSKPLHDSGRRPGVSSATQRAWSAYDHIVGVHRGFDRASEVFAAAVAELITVQVRPEISVEEMPAPSRIAPFAFALSGDVAVGQDDIGTGRFIVLHDPAGQDAWDGTYRCVTFARAEVEHEMAVDEWLPSVGWSWLVDALDARGAERHAPSGSVTVVHTEAFGDMSGERHRAQVELRASWTPTGDLAAHVQAWADTLGAIAGLPPLPDGVVPLRPRGGRS